MSEFEKIECSCADAYVSRDLLDPNCCAHSCDYNDAVDRIAELQREKAELVAQVENLKSKASHVLEYGVFYTYMQPLKDAIEATPTQCLNQIKAEAIDSAVDFEDGRYCETVGDRIDMILDYAKKLRSGEIHS